MSTPGTELKNVIGDADALIALINKDDANNPAAIAASKVLDSTEAAVFFLDATIAEATTAFKRRLNSPQHAEVLVKHCKQGIIQVRHPDDAVIQRAYDMFEPYNSKQHTFFDYLVAAAAKEWACDAVFAFDGLYKKLGLKLVSDYMAMYGDQTQQR